MMEWKTLPVEFITIDSSESFDDDGKSFSLLNEYGSDYDDDLSEISFITQQRDSIYLPASPALTPLPAACGATDTPVRSDMSLLSFASRSRCSISLSFDESSFDESSFDELSFDNQEPTVPSEVAISENLCPSKHGHEWFSSFFTLPSTYMTHLVSSYNAISASKVMAPTSIDDDLSVSLSDESIQLEQIENKFQSIETQYLKSMVQCIQLNPKTAFDESSMKQRNSAFTVLQSLWQGNVNDKR